jgi:hypothetical protein
VLLFHCLYYVWALKEKSIAIMGILSMDMSFILNNMSMQEKHPTAVFVLRDRLLVSLKLTTTVDWKRSSNCNIIVSKIKYFYSNVIGMTQLTEESE